jgi:hypothetical protein
VLSVVIMREGNGLTLPFVFKSEDTGIGAIRAHVAPGSTIYTDEASHWDSLHARYLTKRIGAFYPTPDFLTPKYRFHKR